MKRHNSEQWIPVRESLCRVLNQPLSSLVSVESALVVEEAEQWSIPESDREALREWGLPRHPLFTCRSQSGLDPVLVPNRAGEYERRLVREGQQLYELGYWGTDPTSCVVGVVPGEGRVLCLLPEPITVEDLPEILRPYHSGFTSLRSPSSTPHLPSTLRRRGGGMRPYRSFGRSRSLRPQLWKRNSCNTPTAMRAWTSW